MIRRINIGETKKISSSHKHRYGNVAQVDVCLCADDNKRSGKCHAQTSNTKSLSTIQREISEWYRGESGIIKFFAKSFKNKARIYENLDENTFPLTYSLTNI